MNIHFADLISLIEQTLCHFSKTHFLISFFRFYRQKITDLVSFTLQQFLSYFSFLISPRPAFRLDEVFAYHNFVLLFLPPFRKLLALPLASKVCFSFLAAGTSLFYMRRARKKILMVGLTFRENKSVIAFQGFQR